MVGFQNVATVLHFVEMVRLQNVATVLHILEMVRLQNVATVLHFLEMVRLQNVATVLHFVEMVRFHHQRYLHFLILHDEDLNRHYCDYFQLFFWCVDMDLLFLF